MMNMMPALAADCSPRLVHARAATFSKKDAVTRGIVVESSHFTAIVSTAILTRLQLS
jgi:hypothetical protein